MTSILEHKLVFLSCLEIDISLVGLLLFWFYNTFYIEVSLTAGCTTSSKAYPLFVVLSMLYLSHVKPQIILVLTPISIESYALVWLFEWMIPNRIRRSALLFHNPCHSAAFSVRDWVTSRPQLFTFLLMCIYRTGLLKTMESIVRILFGFFTKPEDAFEP